MFSTVHFNFWHEVSVFSMRVTCIISSRGSGSTKPQKNYTTTVSGAVSCVNESTEVCGGPVVRKMVLLSSRGSGSTKPQKNYTTTVRGAVSCVNESTEVCGGPVVPKDGAINQ